MLRCTNFALKASLRNLVDEVVLPSCHPTCRCYLDLAARTPDYDTQVMLGEALLAVQEPGQAVRAFEAALELNPRDSGLACRIGKALVATHDYQRAVDYFNKAIRNSPGGVQGGGCAAHTCPCVMLWWWPLTQTPTTFSCACQHAQQVLRGLPPAAAVQATSSCSTTWLSC
jgi:tetratricopeptide (TPR) repeat protein